MNIGKNRFRVLVVIGFLLVCAAIVYLQTFPASPPPLEPLTIATGSGEFSALTLVADEKGFFNKYGLNATIRDYPTGVIAMNELLAGNADLACAAEFVGVSTSFLPADFRIITSTAKSDVIALLIRNDRGISQPSDLKGKIIAFPKGTAAEFFLGRFLILNGLDMWDVTVKYLNPGQLADSLLRGEADAAIIWEPYVYQINRELGGNVAVWPAQGGQRFYWVTYTRDDVVRTRPAMIRQYLQALYEAETSLYTDEPGTREIMKRRMNLTDDYMAGAWQKTQFGLSLDQGLILAMEDESRWMAAENMTGGNPAPSYLDLIVQEPMREVKPAAVTIIR
jgi:NitT/TauT family transport system substrate-binding protein